MYCVVTYNKQTEEQNFNEIVYNMKWTNEIVMNLSFVLGWNVIALWEEI